MILTVTLNPSIDHTLFVQSLHVGDTNRVQRTETDAGGKGLNLSRVAHRLGAPTLAMGLVGGATGASIAARLDGDGVDHLLIPIAGETRVNFSVETEAGDAPPTTLNARGPTVGAEEWQAFLAAYRARVEHAQFVALAGSVPPGISVEVYRELAEIGSSAGAAVLIDADGDLLRHGLKARPHLIKPNEYEAARLLGRPVPETDEDAVRAAVELRTELHPDGCAVISRGKAGAVMACGDGVFLGRSPAVESRSTVGSGDSMLAGILSSRLRGEDWPTALQWGLASGAATATTSGADIAPTAVIELLFDDASIERAG